ncbi:hypothetical protein [Edaphobacter aggregans]|uniref:hypothetical protein n=1 Tax=Edaphobacter aggregans TaxID=570835 RepID=UPI0012FCCDC7|nr:hypothetical protein [Edaphobacter aggregans]
MATIRDKLGHINHNHMVLKTAPKAYKRSTSLENSTWYKGILVTQLAGEADTGGAFDFFVSKMRKGTEPPLHVHARDDEFFRMRLAFREKHGFTGCNFEHLTVPDSI